MLQSVRANWPEKAGFQIDRPEGMQTYTFLQFNTGMDVRIGNEMVEAKSGACIFYAPNTPQFFRSDRDVRHDWFHTDAQLGALLKDYQIPENVLLYPQNNDAVTSAIYKMESEFYGSKPYRTQRLQTLMQDFLIVFARLISQTEELPISAKEISWLRSVRTEIFSRIEESWSVEKMVQLAGMSQPQFFSKYKQVFGISPVNDLILARINAAKNLLLFSDKQIQQIAFMLGYTNEYHFIRQFHKFVGESPGSYRKNN